MMNRKGEQNRGRSREQGVLTDERNEVTMKPANQPTIYIQGITFMVINRFPCVPLT